MGAIPQKPIVALLGKASLAFARMGEMPASAEEVWVTCASPETPGYIAE